MRAVTLLGAVLGVLLVGGTLLYVHDRERRIAQAEERMEESARRLSDLEAERLWQRLDDAAQALEPELEEAKRKEAVSRLKREIHKLKTTLRLDVSGNK
jgi:tRNA A37 N6-isopentenylltransferase MiaA